MLWSSNTGSVMDLIEKLKELEYAKKAVEHCLKSRFNMVDMHGLKYWAERVEILREQIEL